MVRRSVLEVVGWFDENLPSVQDWDLYIRIAKSMNSPLLGASFCGTILEKTVLLRNLKAKAVGLDMFLEKHESEMSQIPSAFSAQIVEAGHYYCRSGSVSEGRHMFLRAIRVHPFAVRSYLFLFFRSWVLGSMTVLFPTQGVCVCLSILSERKMAQYLECVSHPIQQCWMLGHWWVARRGVCSMSGGARAWNGGTG
jgi:hypothetical protein